MKENKQEITKKLLLLNYLNFGDFEMFKVFLENLLIKDKIFAKEVCLLIMRKAKNSFFQELDSKASRVTLNNIFHSYVLRVIKENFINEFSELEVKHFEDLVEFDFLIISIIKKTQDINLKLYNEKLTVFQDIRQKIFQRESPSQEIFFKSQEEYTENIETLKYVFTNFPKESKALFTIINNYQMQYPSDHSLSYIDIVLKDILQNSLSEGKFDLFSTYISFIRNEAFVKSGFTDRTYEILIKSRQGPSKTQENYSQIDFIQLLEGFLQDPSLLGIKDFEAYILKTRFVCKKDEENIIERFKKILKALESQQYPLGIGFWEALTIFSFTNKTNPLKLLLNVILSCFQDQEFQYIETILQYITNLRDLVLLTIANNVPEDSVEKYCLLSEKIQEIIKGNDPFPHETKESKDPAIRKLEHISQELQFKVLIMKQFFRRKQAEKPGKNSNETFGQFYKQNQTSLQKTFQTVIKSLNDVNELIVNLQGVSIDKSNGKLLERKQGILNALRTIQVKWGILDQFRDSIVNKKSGLQNLLPETLDLVENLIDNVQKDDEIISAIRLFQSLFLIKSKNIKDNEFHGKEIENQSLLGSETLSEIAQILHLLLNKFPKDSHNFSPLNKTMKKLSIRNELFLRLKKASLLVNEESEEGRQGLDWKDSIDRSYVNDSKKHCDYQEIYFGNPYFLLKYVILLKDRAFFDEFCHIFDISSDIYKDTLQLLELKTGLINQNQGIISIIDDILLGNSSISSVEKEDTPLLNAPLFKGFTELPLMEEGKHASHEVKTAASDSISTKEVQVSKDLSLSFRREIENLLENLSENKLNYCLPTLKQYDNRYGHLYRFIYYLDKLYKILKDSLEKNNVPLSYSIEDLCQKLFLTMNPEQFIRFLSTIDSRGPELAAILARRLNIDIFSAIFSKENLESHHSQNQLQLSTRFEWVLKEELSKNLRFFTYTSVPFSTIFCLLKNDGISQQKIPKEQFEKLREMVRFCKENGNEALARYFQCVLKKEQRKSKQKKTLKKNLNEFLPQSEGYLFSPAQAKDQKVSPSSSKNTESLLALMLIGNEEEIKQTKKDKILSNVISTEISEKTFEDFDVSDLLQDFKISFDGNFEFDGSLDPQTSISSNKEERKEAVLLLDIVSDEYYTIESMNIMLQDFPIEKEEIKETLLEVFDRVLMHLKSNVLSKSSLTNLKQTLDKVEHLIERYGPFKLEFRLTDISLIIDLFRLSLDNNVPTSYKPQLFKDPKVLIQKLSNRIIDNGYSNKLIDLFEQKGLDTTFILKKMFKTCLALNDMKEARMIADSLIRASGTAPKQNDTLEFIIETFETLSYENSMNYISRVKTQQVFKQCKIVPDAETERNIAKEREKFETILQNECHYYLNKYGTPEKQVIHYERNNQYEKAYEIVLQKGVSQQFFAEKFVKNVYEKDKLPEIRQIVQKMDPELNKSLDYLKVIIDFLKKNYIQDELFHFQILVGDFFSIAERFLEQFKESKALKDRIKHLQEAETYFKLFIENPFLVKLSHKTANDAKEALNRVRIQREIIDEFPEYANYHLFGGKIVVFALLQRVMMGNVQGTFNLITRLDISLGEFIEETLKTLSNEAVDLGTIEEIVQNLVQLKTKALETHGIEVVEQNWDENLYDLGVHLITKNPDYVRSKIVSRIKDGKLIQKLLTKLSH